MVKNPLTIRQNLNLDNFDPMNIDVSEFDELSKSVPLDANIDIGIAEVMASKCLRAADRCSEILSTLIWFENKIKTEKNSTRSRLYLEAKDNGFKTIDDRKAYAECHPEFVALDEKFSEAYATRKFFEMRHDFFLKSHQFMKEKLRSELNHQNFSGFSETYGHDDNNHNEKEFGEKKW